MPYPDLQKDTLFISEQNHEMIIACRLANKVKSMLKNLSSYQNNYIPIAVSCIDDKLNIDDPAESCKRVINYIKLNIA
jgi:hypothetical protein